MTELRDPLAARIVDTVHEPLLVLDDRLRVVQAHPSFYRTFETSPPSSASFGLVAAPLRAAGFRG